MSVRVSVEGDPKAVHDYLRGIYQQQSRVESEGQTKELPTEQYAKGLISHLSPRAKSLLRFLVDRADRRWVNQREISDAFDLIPKALGGINSSFGFAENAGYEKPYISEYRDGTKYYIMKDGYAQVFRKVMK